MEERRSALPTRKWIATQVTAAAAFSIGWVTAAAWNSTLSIALIGLISQAVISYLVPNADQPGGGAVTAAAAFGAATPVPAGSDRPTAATVAGQGRGA